jgi:aconitate hydratase
MGVLPLQFRAGESANTHGLTGTETFEIHGITEGLAPGKTLTVIAKGPSGDKSFEVRCRVDTPIEVEYVLHGGILQYVLRQMAKA